MVLNGKKRILIADADLLSTVTLIGALKDEYHIVTAKTGADIFKQLRKNSVNLVILETALPDIDGFELCRQLKLDEQSKELPVVFVTSLNTVAEEAKGFEAGAVEYITKPFNAPTVKARIKNQLALSSAIKELQRLNQLALDANPNTGLPGNTSILNELHRVVETGEAACVIYADLDNFKAFNDTYGFAKGDEIIKFTANVIKVALQANGCGEAFFGHIGGDDFVLVLPVDKYRAVAEEIVRRIDTGIPEFYSPEDVARGYVLAANREGLEKQHPLVSLSMGAVDLTKRKVTCAFAIIDICTETKNAAKKHPGSNVVVDQRSSS